MAASTASSSSSSTSADSASSAQSKACSLFSSSSQTASVKLDRTNYLFWESVVLSLIEGHKLTSHIDGLVSPLPHWPIMEASLLAFETRMEQLNRFASLTVQPAVNVAQRGDSDNSSNNNSNAGKGNGNCRGNFRGGRRGRGHGPNGGSRPYCHLCEKAGQTVSNCYYRIYVSRHVVFDSSIFPFANGFLNRRVSSSLTNNDEIPALVINRDISRSSNVPEVEGDKSSSTATRSMAQMSPTATHPVTEIVPRGLADSENLSSSREGSCAPNGSAGLAPFSLESTGTAHSNETLSAKDSHAQPAPPSEAQTTQQHHMVTRAKLGIHKPKYPYIGLLKTETPISMDTASEPRSVTEALSKPHWKKAMLEELQALQRNKMWVLIPYDGRQKTLLQWGFQNARSDTSLFFLRHKGLTVYILIYVDDILVTGSDVNYLKNFVQKLNALFALKDLGPLYYFLGLEIYRDSSGFYLNQSKYTIDLLKKFHLSDCAPVSIPMITGATRLFSCSSAIQAEAKALRDAASLIASLGLNQVTVETDCLELASAFNGSSPCWIIEAILSDVRAVHPSLAPKVLHWIRRDANKVADLVAKLAIRRELPFIWTWNPPVSIRAALLEDKIHCIPRLVRFCIFAPAV
ncbi:Copia protein [Senna tora]|uniref:Copia protein n=1 Tax=Senna tora TaxID=362788 RepID=A0A834XGG7_9FABA|nr:Copia protein [Senna tora]